MIEAGGNPTDDEVHLRTREHIETAWLAVNITGNAPNAEPILEAVLGLMPPGNTPDESRGASIYLKGNMARQIKLEIIGSLEIVIASLGEESDTTAAAKGLLAMLVKPYVITD